MVKKVNKKKKKAKGWGWKVWLGIIVAVLVIAHLYFLSCSGTLASPTPEVIVSCEEACNEKVGEDSFFAGPIYNGCSIGKAWTCTCLSEGVKTKVRV